MRADKEKAIQLRRQGKSYKQIRQELGIATSTLASWFKNEPWSQDIKTRLSAAVSWSNPKKLELLARANSERWRLKHEEYRLAATKEFERLKDDPLFLAGIMLYWGEGDKTAKNGVIRLGNSDPEMLKLFNLFLTKSIGVSQDKIYAWLLLYPDLVDSVQKNFWSKTTSIPKERFKKSIFIKGRYPKKRLSYGVCTVCVNSRALKERILKWLELYQNYLKSHILDIEKT
jgi:transposase-like protein